MAQESAPDSFFAKMMENIREEEDKRVENWFLMDKINTVLYISIAYVIFCKYVGHRLMKNREPFSLKKTIIVYNIIQILLCIWFSYKIIKDGIWIGTSLICDPEEFNPYEAIDIMYWALYLKMMELIETVFFILRKKQSQVTNLHLYHHSTTFVFVWLGVKYRAGLGMTTFLLMNCIVHIIMYTYYTLSAIDSLQKNIAKYKKYITIIQMVQFTIILLQVARFVIANCVETWVLCLLFVPNVAVVYYMFYDFYKSIYIEKKER